MTCKYYPMSMYEILNFGGVCLAGCHIKNFVCTKEEEEKCEYAKETIGRREVAIELQSAIYSDRKRL